MLFLFFGQFGNEHLINLIALQNELLFYHLSAQPVGCADVQTEQLAVQSLHLTAHGAMAVGLFADAGAVFGFLARPGLAAQHGGDRYTITDKGRKVAQELAYDLPRSVRERAVAAVLRCQTWARKEAKYSASITEKPDGHCSVRCTVKGLDEALFCLDLGTPDRLSAELVKKQFILKGNEIYQLLVNKLTEENA